MYTINVNDDVDKKINSHMSLIVNHILESADDVSTVVLTGGFGRGEGSVLFDKAKCQPLNDYDITVIAKRWKPSLDINLLRVKLAGLCGIRQVDLSLKTKKDISTLKFTMANYDFINASTVIYGDKHWAINLPKWHPADMPIKEGMYPLFLFLSSVIQAYPRDKQMKEEDLFWSYQQLTKSILGWSTAMLVFDGLYDPSYYKRNIMFQERYSNNKELCCLVKKATEFKLAPSINPCKQSEINNIWKMASDAHIDVMKDLISKFYKIKFTNWDNLIIRHKYSAANILKKILSVIFRHHHYQNCLDTDIAKLYMCLSINNNNNEYFNKSQNYYKKLKLKERLQNPSNDYNEYICQLIMADINARIFFEQGNTIYYD